MEDNDLVRGNWRYEDVSTWEEMDPGPSRFMEGSVASSPRSGSAQQKHEIFLSHSGAQKAFVRRVRNALERNAYCPFFDEDPDCLPKGEPFAHRLETASRLADVAVVVLSDDFFISKWPMIELAIFIKEQKRRKSLPDRKELKILPLFMGFSVEEFRKTERQTCWQNKWNEIRVRDDRIDVSVWKEALKVLGGTNGLEYCRYKNEEEYIDSIMSAIFKLVTPDLKWEDSYMKGKSKFHQAVAKMFASSPSKTRFHNVRAIGLYGVGGIGKTTLCKSLCNDYRGKFNGKVWHAELGKNNAEEIQKDVLYHLVGTSETLLKTLNCKDQWQSLLRKRIEYKVFLAIDNVWNEDISRKQAEVLLEMGFHPDSLVIVTSRSREVLEWLGIHEDCCFKMPVLDKSDATEVLLHSMAPGFDIQSLAADQRSAVDKAVERCFMMKGPISSAGSEKQYVPLALEVLGRELRVPLLRDTSRQNDNTSASVSESLVHCEVFDAILRILEDPERRGLESGHSHADAAQARNILKISGKRVGHTSLVEPGASVVAAREIHVNAKGVWKNINCQSGHFQVPLEIMEGQMGRVFPRSVLTYRSPTWYRVLSVANHFTHVAVYTTSLIAVLNTQSTSPPLASSTFILAFHEHTAVKTIALGDVDFTHAKQAFDAVPLSFAKVLIQKPTNTVLCRHGWNEYVDMCIQQVRQINAVFPQGNWRKTSKDLESCFDPKTGMFVLRCSCANRYGGWVVNSIEFLPEDRFYNQDGKLVQLIGALHLLCPCFLYGKSKTTPAAEPLARPPRGPSDPGNYKPFPVVPDSAPQISLADLRGNIDTAALVKEFRTPLDVTRGLESGQGYDFVWIQDGSCRAISHADAAQARNILKISGKRVGHTSLVEPGASVMAAGEIHVNAKGVWKNINCQSGHFQVPLEIMEGQMGRVFPRSVLTYLWPTWNRVLSVANHFTHVAVYTTSLIAVLNTQSTSPPLASSTFILAFHEHTAVKTIALGDVDFTHAKQAFDAVPLSFAKVLIQKPTNTVLCRHGWNEYVDMCIQQVRQINAVFPQGNWRKTSKDLESCFDPKTGMFVLRCSCANRYGGWVVNSVEFLPEDRFDNQNGKLVQLN